MTEPFDPYYQWLGIPAKDQPPNHYRLLGLDDFESNPDVIEAAADRQMAHVRTYQTGQHSNLSQKVLNEVAAARVCLLNPEKKADYDASLRAKAMPVVSSTAAPVRKRSNRKPTIIAGVGVAAVLLVAVIILAINSGSEKPQQPAVASAQPAANAPPQPPSVVSQVKPEPIRVEPKPEPQPEPPRPENSLGNLLNQTRTSTRTRFPASCSKNNTGPR